MVNSKYPAAKDLIRIVRGFVLYFCAKQPNNLKQPDKLRPFYVLDASTAADGFNYDIDDPHAYEAKLVPITHTDPENKHLNDDYSLYNLPVPSELQKALSSKSNDPRPSFLNVSGVYTINLSEFVKQNQMPQIMLKPNEWLPDDWDQQSTIKDQLGTSVADQSNQINSAYQHGQISKDVFQNFNISEQFDPEVTRINQQNLRAGLPRLNGDSLRPSDFETANKLYRNQIPFVHDPKKTKKHNKSRNLDNDFEL